jgi:hypothetical protein
MSNWTNSWEFPHLFLFKILNIWKDFEKADGYGKKNKQTKNSNGVFIV